MNLIVAIATAGRRELLKDTIPFLQHQTRRPDAFYICPAAEKDLDPACLIGLPFRVETVSGAAGLPAQRNAILKSAPKDSIIVFFDDDFLAGPGYLEELESLFLENSEVVIATGHVLEDGATGPGYTFDEGQRFLENAPARHAPRPLFQVYNGYGCNMAVRASVCHERQVWFDEMLPLYAWWEDVDFSRRLAKFGTVMYDGWLQGVHLGSKAGRTPGKRLGYSQVANIVHMMKKGSVSPLVGWRRMGQNILANLVRTLNPEPWVDRRGRVLGNWVAIADWCKGTIYPGKILEM